MTQAKTHDNGLRLAVLKSNTPFLLPQNASGTRGVPGDGCADQQQEAANAPDSKN